MRIIGTLTKWNDDRGFGFILPNQNGDEIFLHFTERPEYPDGQLWRRGAL